MVECLKKSMDFQHISNSTPQLVETVERANELIQELELTPSSLYVTTSFFIHQLHAKNLEAQGYHSRGNISSYTKVQRDPNVPLMKQELLEEMLEASHRLNQRDYILYPFLTFPVSQALTRLEAEILNLTLSGHKYVLTSAFTSSGKPIANSVQIWEHRNNLEYLAPLQEQKRQEHHVPLTTPPEKGSGFLGMGINIELGEKYQRPFLYKRGDTITNLKDLAVIPPDYASYKPVTLQDREGLMPLLTQFLSLYNQYRPDRSLYVFDFSFPTASEVNKAFDKARKDLARPMKPKELEPQPRPSLHLVENPTTEE